MELALPSPFASVVQRPASRQVRAYRLMCRAINHHRAVYARWGTHQDQAARIRALDRCADLCRLTYRLALVAGEKV